MSSSGCYFRLPTDSVSRTPRFVRKSQVDSKYPIENTAHMAFYLLYHSIITEAVGSAVRLRKKSALNTSIHTYIYPSTTNNNYKNNSNNRHTAYGEYELE